MKSTDVDSVKKFLEEEEVLRLRDYDEGGRAEAFISEITSFSSMYNNSVSYKDSLIKSKVFEWISNIKRIVSVGKETEAEWFLGPIFNARAAKLCVVFCLGKDKAQELYDTYFIEVQAHGEASSNIG
jgi:hypothetical protein